MFDISADEIEYKLGDLFLLDSDDSWSGFWKPLNGKFHDDSDKHNVIKIPDITLWFTGHILCSEKAYKTLKSKLESYGEWLEVKVEGASFWLLHVMKKTGLDYVDLDNSDRNIDMIGNIEIKKITFKNDLVKDLLLFKTAYNNYENIYCTDKFKNIIESAGLTGLVFSTDMTNSPY